MTTKDKKITLSKALSLKMIRKYGAKAPKVINTIIRNHFTMLRGENTLS